MKKESKRYQEVVEDRRHESRATENRAFESRTIQKRPRSYGERKNHLDVNNVPDGFEYKWIRKDVHGDPDTSRVIEATEDGWRPVPSSRHPEKIQEDFFGNSTHIKGHIERKGGILCEREKHLCEEERAAYEEINRAELRSLPGTNELTAHPYMPGFVQTNKTTFGNTPYD
jgi:hypothetical protein